MPTTEEMREGIMSIEGALGQMPQVDIQIEHYFADGLYVREAHVPAGVMFTGKIHKTEHLCICSKGHFTIMTESGGVEVFAPAVIHSAIGTKRVGFAHEDSVWVNIHATHEKDIEKIEDIMVTNSYDDPELVAILSAIDQAKLEGAA